MVKTSINLPDALREEIDDGRHAATSRSEWLAEAARVRLELEDRSDWAEILDDITVEEQPAD